MYIIKKAPISETGITSIGISVARQLLKKEVNYDYYK